MRALAGWIMALGLVVSPAMAGTGGSGDGTAPAARTSDAPAAPSKVSAPAKSEAATLENELQELRDLIETQSKQLQEQNEALKQQQQKMQALENQLRAAANVPRENVAAIPAAAPSSPSPSPVTATAAMGTTVPNAAPSAAKAALPQGANADEPASLHYKGITLTPGGFMAAETVWRQKALSADVNTPFNAIPMPGSSQSSTSEFNASGRQSRIAMLMEGKLTSVKIGGYYEADFLSGGTTSNSNESNSYTLRQRQFWGQAAFNSGWTVTGGQMWSLVTETKQGVDNRTEALPMTIDAQYQVGFSWARQYGFRVAKSFGNKTWLAFSVENPQTTFGVHGQNNNFLLGAPGAGGGLYNPVANYSFNKAPDLIFKAVFQPGFGHYEIFGVVSQFRDRVFPNAVGSTPSAAGAFNDSRTGGGIGANARVSMFNKHVDAGIHVLAGSGIGRYGTAGLPDATVRPDGTLALVRSYQALGTLEWHSPKWDIYSNVGGEYAGRAAYLNGAKGEGYGSPLFANFGCYTEPVPGSPVSTPNGVGGGAGYVPGGLVNCTGDTRNIIEGTIGFWYRFYKGSKGTVQWGPQFSYVARSTWSGTGATPGTYNEPHAIEPMVFTSFRYYLP